MKRFLKTLVLLVVSLFIVVSGVDAALGHIARSTTQSSLTVYNEQGTVVLAYTGDLSACKVYAKPAVTAPAFLHRT